ncbi:discoidin domain-containing protein [Bacillus haimaensis]|uniref:discoidin domain-containing protein n=1 Tax=Bacillus haimaensis TaxID=3160967 RepID=UPI003AA9BA19
MKKPLRKWRWLLGLSIVVLILVISVKSFSLSQEKPAASGLGPIIPIASVHADFDEGYDAKNVANNSGMSGTDGTANTHSTEGKTMWQVTAKEDNEHISLILDLGHIQPLGEMWVWNYMAKDGEQSLSHRGLKNVRIYYSNDNKEWTEWKGEGYPFRFAKGKDSDSMQATNLSNSQLPIQFNGVPAQYVKIEADTNSGEGNWSDSKGERIFGLSEIRIFRHNVGVVENGQIIPLAATPDEDSNTIQGPENVINHHGMFKEEITETHGTDPDTMWLASSDNKEPPTITIDLGGTYPLQAMEIWNYNEKGKESRGIKNVQIFHSLDGENWTELKGRGYPYELAEGTGSVDLQATNLNDDEHTPILFDGTQAKFVKLIPHQEEGNWGAEEQGKHLYGLSEVRFTAAAGIAVEPMYEWDALFSRYEGWSGADGIFSIPFDGYDVPGKAKDNKTLFLFSDTFIGNVHPVTKQRLQSNMLNNSLAVLEGEKPNPNNMEWITMANTADVNLFTPKTPNAPAGSWYWLQDGVVIGDHVYIFPLLMSKDLQGEAGFLFAISGVSMVKLPVSEDGPIVEEQEQMDTPLFASLPDGSGNIVFGAGILDRTEKSGTTNPDGYLYVYGYKDLKSGTKELVVSRVLAENIEQFDLWEYWDGDGWSSDIQEVESLVTGVSPELSVTFMENAPYKGKYLLVVERETLSGYIAVSQADSPAGPFSPLEDLYHVPEAKLGNGVITYNAKAHPHLSESGELLVTYNVNTTNPTGNNTNADIYRPRWLKLREIKPENQE